LRVHVREGATTVNQRVAVVVRGNWSPRGPFGATKVGRAEGSSRGCRQHQVKKQKLVANLPRAKAEERHQGSPPRRAYAL